MNSTASLASIGSIGIAGPMDSPRALPLQESESLFNELSVKLEDAAVPGVGVDHQVAVGQAPGQVDRVLGGHHPVALAVGDEHGLVDDREVLRLISSFRKPWTSRNEESRST
jgi:hypothetical protein